MHNLVTYTSSQVNDAYSPGCNRLDREAYCRPAQSHSSYVVLYNFVLGSKEPQDVQYGVVATVFLQDCH